MVRLVKSNIKFPLLNVYTLTALLMTGPRWQPKLAKFSMV